MLNKLYTKLDNFQSLRSKKLIRSCSYNRRMRKLYTQLGHLIDDVHYRTIDYLAKRYSTVFLPKFESQALGKKIQSSITNRRLFTLKHFQFRQRLLFRSQYTESLDVRLCTEEYTSKTCGRCGTINDVGASDVYRCGKCALVIDRDINGARNILLKCLTAR